MLLITLTPQLLSKAKAPPLLMGLVRLFSDVVLSATAFSLRKDENGHSDSFDHV